MAGNVPMSWGQWTYDPDAFALNYEVDRYQIDLDECTNSSQILDWIFQARAKNWSNATTVADLLTALRDLLQPQATVCSNGIDKTIDPVAVARSNGYPTP